MDVPIFPIPNSANHSSSGLEPFAVRSPFFCPPGEGWLQKRDLVKFYELVQPESDHPMNPEGGLWHLHLSFRLLKAWSVSSGSISRTTRDVEILKRYTELIRQVKFNTTLSSERREELRQEISTLESKALSPEECGFCHKHDGDGCKLLHCARCKIQAYCNRECQRQHWSVHKPSCRKVKVAQLQDTAEMQQRFPDAFEVPDRGELQEIEPGVLVKVCVPRHERFWVRVEAIIKYDTNNNPTKFVGQVDNVLTCTAAHKLKYQDRIEFGPGHVYQVMWPWKSMLG